MDEEAITTSEMSVELATRRELAYRHKVARLGLRSENPSQHLLHLQVPSSSCQDKASNPTSKPTPSKNQFQKSQPLPNTIPNRPNHISKPPRPQNPVPKSTQIRTPSSNPWPIISGTKRKETTSNSQEKKPRKPRPSPNQADHVTTTPHGYSYCNLCEVPLSGRLNKKQHLEGRQHKNKLKLLEMSRNGISSLSCEVCQIQCTDVAGLKVHYESKRHHSKLRELELGGEKKYGRTCELCKNWCIDEVAYQQHLRGKNHLARVDSAEYGQNCS